MSAIHLRSRLVADNPIDNEKDCLAGSLIRPVLMQLGLVGGRTVSRRSFLSGFVLAKGGYQFGHWHAYTLG